MTLTSCYRAGFAQVGSEAALLATLMLIVLLKVDLSKEDIPGGEDFIGFLMLMSNTALPGGALAVAILSFGLDSTRLAKAMDSKAEVDFEDNPVADGFDE